MALQEDEVELTVGPHRRTVRLVRREDVSAGAPIVLLLHGSNQTGAVLRRFAGNTFDALAERDGAIVAYLDGYRGHWNDARIGSEFAARKEGYDDVAFVLAVLDHVVARFGADRGRAFVVGYSNGGSLVLRLAHEVPEVFAGLATISATLPVPSNHLLEGRAAAPVPMLHIHGTADRLVPYEGGMASLWGFRPRGLGLSAPATAEHSAAQNGITTAPTTETLPSAAGDGTTVSIASWRQEGRPPVDLVTIGRGGHTVPGPKKAPFMMGRTSRTVTAADLAADFFGLR